MRAFTTVLFLTAFLVLIGMPEKILAGPNRPRHTIPPPGPHEEYQQCGTWCTNTCDNPNAEEGACIAMCKRGNFCVHGYIRDTSSGNCILRSECPPQTAAESRQKN